MNEIHSTDALWSALADLFAAQHLAVLATHGQGQPYTSLMAFAASTDLKHLFFVTGMATRKFANLEHNPRVAMMIDNRSNAPTDIADAMAVTATGTVEVVSPNDPDNPDELAECRHLYLQKHPHLAEFVQAPSTRMIRLNVACYYVVRRFQQVVELHMR